MPSIAYIAIVVALVLATVMALSLASIAGDQDDTNGDRDLVLAPNDEA